MAFWELVIEGRQGANDMLNVIHYESSGVEPPDFAAAATVIRGHLADHLQGQASGRVTWEGITVREDIPGGVGVFIPFPGGILTGNNPDPDHADLLTVLVRKITGSLVKPTLGWAQQGGMTAGALEPDGTWNAGVRAAVEAFWEDIRILNITGPTTLQMVIKARNPSAPNTQPYTVVNAVEANLRPRSLRSRIELSGS